jgi:hypothetical protein
MAWIPAFAGMTGLSRSNDNTAYSIRGFRPHIATRRMSAFPPGRRLKD